MLPTAAEKAVSVLSQQRRIRSPHTMKLPFLENQQRIKLPKPEDKKKTTKTNKQTKNIRSTLIVL
jgi:hypothetical protein